MNNCSTIIQTTDEYPFNCSILIAERNLIMKKTFAIDVDCASCAAKMEKAAENTKGVCSAVVSYMTQKMKIEFENGADIDETMKCILKSCKKIDDDCNIYI